MALSATQSDGWFDATCQTPPQPRCTAAEPAGTASISRDQGPRTRAPAPPRAP